MNTCDLTKIRADFPILQQKIKGSPLVYLDNAASTQKPYAVIQRLHHFYQYENSNVHRGIHTLSELATHAFEQSRQKVQHFIHAKSSAEIIFVRGTTEAINLVAQTYGLSHLRAGDEIIISHMEHHANIVPWQILCEQTGAQLKIIPINDAGELVLEEYQRLLNAKTKLVSICHVSNTLGTINPIQSIIDWAHANSPETKVLIDGAQAVAHQKIDVHALDCDFYAFSGHKLFAPTGIGVLYGKYELLARMPPYQGGGSMITEVGLKKSHYREPPYKFEAGTPHIAGAVGLGAAIDYLNQLDFNVIHCHEQQLLDYAIQHLQAIQGLRFIGMAKEKAAILNFIVNDSRGRRIHGHDISDVLNAEVGVAVRAGQHCTMPLMQRFDVDSTVRVSMALYNNKEDIDALIRGLHILKQLFK
ncbi:SufS family cysteine desulfurase [Rickettsiella grylli]|uniref:Cysteine desulfurase n=1 Tax=Rickettsiella grylli TaxID=59196 RepID=A8PN09_9COXI|nr:SufS family cysteine desulfurase [Rickettsiella grylli]EDP45659.1 aminotransferase, class-V [Rickettsiella grylli]